MQPRRCVFGLGTHEVIKIAQTRFRGSVQICGLVRLLRVFSRGLAFVTGRHRIHGDDQ
jgi:hypothetical protein